jgi:hypothetical protein
MKNSNDTIGNQSCDLPVCSAVPQPLRHRVPPQPIVPTESHCRNLIYIHISLVIMPTVHETKIRLLLIISTVAEHKNLTT